MKIGKNFSVFISIAGMSPSWIVGKISEDIRNELIQRGIRCNYGPPNKYNGEDICHHMGWAYAKPNNSAKINSVFITHIDDKLKELQLIKMKDKFDYFFTMSNEDKDFLLQLGFDSKKVFGIKLPVRNNYVKPVSIGIFSAMYEDGRKNEKWILDYCKNQILSKIINFVFIGPRWSSFILKLEKLNVSFEWHSVSNEMPFEYHFQQNKLNSLDYYFYLGMDGGAMGTYDAYAYGKRLIISDNCYHKEIPNVDYPIKNFSEFKSVMDQICENQHIKLNFFKDSNIEQYVSKIISIWTKKTLITNSFNTNSDIVKKRRYNYFKISLRRFMGYIKRLLFKS